MGQSKGRFLSKRLSRFKVSPLDNRMLKNASAFLERQLVAFFMPRRAKYTPRTNLAICSRGISSLRKVYRLKRRASERSSGKCRQRLSAGIPSPDRSPSAVTLTWNAKTEKNTAGSPCGAYIENVSITFFCY